MTTTYGNLNALTPGFQTQVEVIRAGVSTPPELGMVVSRQTRTAVSRQGGQASTRVWQIEYLLTDTERTALLAAFDAGLAGALPLLFNAPPPDDGSAIPVRFLGDELEIEYVRSSKLYRARAELEEVI